MEQLKDIITNSIPLNFTLEHPEEILKFNDCRCELEKRLKEVDATTAAAYEPVIAWMRLVVSKWAPELLNDKKDEKTAPQPNFRLFSQEG